MEYKSSRVEPSVLGLGVQGKGLGRDYRWLAGLGGRDLNGQKSSFPEVLYG